MTGALKVESRDMSLSDVLKEFYAVPDFQREYVWEPKHVEKLLQDVLDEFQADGGGFKDGGEYFIGSIVVCLADDGTFQLIDGQQRMTTSYLLLCVARDILRSSPDGAPKVLEAQIADAKADPRTGEDVALHRLVLQYEDSQDILKKIASSSIPVDQIPGTTRSVSHIIDAYKTIREYLGAQFKNDPKRIKQFIAVFTLRVKVVRIVTPNLPNALKVFETINARGVGLSAMDLLKNLLFMRTRPNEYSKLKEQWKALNRTLERCSEKPLRFLRYFIMAQFETDWANGFREEEIYPWFRKHGKEAGIDDAPLSFADKLTEFAKRYANYINGKDSQGNPSQHLKNIGLLSGVARQHLILLLACQNLPSDAFTELTRQIENLLFCYIITREPTRTFERNFARWSKDLRAVAELSGLQVFIAKYFGPELTERSKRFDFEFEQLSLRNIQQYRMRYILAKLTQSVEEEAWRNPSHSNLEQYFNTAVEIEHILPQRPEQELKAAFDKPDLYDTYIMKLGNLTLLEKTINSSVSNGSYKDKSPGYLQSAFLLTKSLVEKPHVGTNTQLNLAVKDLLQFKTWDSKAIDDRQKMLAKLARSVWLPGIGTDQEGH